MKFYTPCRINTFTPLVKSLLGRMKVKVGQTVQRDSVKNLLDCQGGHLVLPYLYTVNCYIYNTNS